LKTSDQKKKKNQDKARDKAQSLIRRIICPEGLELEFRLATYQERLYAFILDSIFMLALVIFLSLVISNLFGLGRESSQAFLALGCYLILNFYFLHFELAWRGRTPGKKIMGIRVINRRGGELTPTMVIARNLTRQVEIFYPLLFLFQNLGEQSSLLSLIELAFILVMILLPRFSRDHYRLGDLIGGTMVAVTPKATLLEDLSVHAPQASYTFTPKHLGIYGALELNALEKALRLSKFQSSPALRKIAYTIIRKINYGRKVKPDDAVQFLRDFYAAERGLLERERLFGRNKDDKNTPLKPIEPVKPGANPTGKKPLTSLARNRSGASQKP
jgi:uncharacterized RDD family membrane protein YckC